MVQGQPAPPLVVLTFLGRLVAVNAHTGQRAWECDTNALGPLGHDGRLFVDQGLVIYCASRTVICLDYWTGALRWKVGLPVLSGGVPLVFAGCIVFSGLGEAACLAVSNGALIWHDKFQGYGSLSGPMAAPGVAAQVDKS